MDQLNGAHLQGLFPADLSRYKIPRPGRKLSQKQAWFNEIDVYLGGIKPVIFWYWANRNGKDCINRIVAEMKDKEANPVRNRIACFIDECKRNRTSFINYFKRPRPTRYSPEDSGPGR